MRVEQQVVRKSFQLAASRHSQDERSGLDQGFEIHKWAGKVLAGMLVHWVGYRWAELEHRLVLEHCTMVWVGHRRA